MLRTVVQQIFVNQASAAQIERMFGSVGQVLSSQEPRASTRSRVRCPY